MPDMSSEERRAAILSMLDRATSVQVTQLAEAFGVSRVTARADLDALARDGKLRRTHGGAVSLSKTLTVSVQDRRINVNANEHPLVSSLERGATRGEDLPESTCGHLSCRQLRPPINERAYPHYADFVRCRQTDCTTPTVAS